MPEDIARESDDREEQYDESELKDRGSLGGAPNVPASDEGVSERCRTQRADLTPKETAQCAGVELAELTENEEDGGS